ncbi:hypothetical protein KDI_45230 [Dictyobacter arantiisoli]|uniref:DUF1275 family protein n=1 Tax=Dictyobacter arantiisoli TaxID=2014874 RepID=A0A5A5TIY8_9CHLR|nr:hypothetical protein KDI_45230 [Dictyobacter arantiisoli]
MPAENKDILLLSGTAGYFDALCYLGLQRVFPANMTGNTVLLGIALGKGMWEDALLTVSAVLGFCLGALLTTLLLKEQRPGVWTSQVVRLFGLEWILLFLFTLLWLFTQATFPTLGITILLILLASLAMGIQSATVMMLGFPGIVTTYITGTLTSLMGNLGNWLRPAHYQRQYPYISHAALTASQKHDIIRQASTWLVYLLGAVLGGAATLYLPTLSVCIPLITIALVIANTVIRQHPPTL